MAYGPTLSGAVTQCERGHPETTVDVIIVTAAGSVELLAACLSSLERAAPTRAETAVTVVDNASRDGLVEAIRARRPEVTVRELDTNSGFAAAVNVGIVTTTGEYVLLLNPDTEVPAGALDRLLGALIDQPAAAMAGPRLVDGQGRPDHNSKRTFPTPTAALRHFLGLGTRPGGGAGAYALSDVDEFAQARVDALSGSCMLVRRAAIEQVGLLDEGYWMYGEDLDWCRRFRAWGWHVLYVGAASIVHHKHGVSGRRLPLRLNWSFHRAMGRFYRKFDGGRRPAVDLVVYAGILAKFAVSAAVGLLRRVGA